MKERSYPPRKMPPSKPQGDLIITKGGKSEEKVDRWEEKMKGKLKVVIEEKEWWCQRRKLVRMRGACPEGKGHQERTKRVQEGK